MTYDNTGYTQATNILRIQFMANNKENLPTSASWFELLRVETSDWPKNILKWTVGSGGNTFEIDIKDPLRTYHIGKFPTTRLPRGISASSKQYIK